MRKIIFFLFVLIVIFPKTYALEGSTKGFPKKAPEIKNLITDEGETFSLENLKDKVIILTYGYTHCPHVCPTILGFLKQVEEQLNLKGYKGKYKIVFISVDPKYDTVERLKKYKKQNEYEDFIFLTGKKDDLEKVWKKYKVFVRDRGMMEMKHGNMIMKHRMVDHTAKVTIIDKNGYIREEFLGMYLPVESIVKDVESLIKE
ncbi:MAG TPA: SCO family protein [Persephonella sp.]|nr:SCO family protein [Hydrogenothermaceae bacterium]HIQ24839.1 SCO family protein [Persephonella sp.]